MAVALEKGGDYADLYFEHTFNTSVSLMDGKAVSYTHLDVYKRQVYMYI